MYIFDNLCSKLDNASTSCFYGFNKNVRSSHLMVIVEALKQKHTTTFIY